MTFPYLVAEWTVLGEVPRPEKQGCHGHYYLCQCSCGEKRILTTSMLKNRKSCGHKKQLPQELIEEAARNGITAKQVYDRLAKGWDEQRACTQKIGTVRSKK